MSSSHSKEAATFRHVSCLFYLPRRRHSFAVQPRSRTARSVLTGISHVRCRTARARAARLCGRPRSIVHSIISVVTGMRVVTTKLTCCRLLTAGPRRLDTLATPRTYTAAIGQRNVFPEVRPSAARHDSGCTCLTTVGVDVAAPVTSGLQKCRRVTGSVMCIISSPKGSLLFVCPRSLLKRIRLD